jgi:Ca-activated chloride channel family protein
MLPALALLTLACAPALADGFVVVRPSPDLPAPVPLAVRYHHVDIEIRDQVGRVQIDQVFRNLNAREVEGEYLFPVPEGAAVSDFTLYVDGRPVHAQAMDAGEALRIYENLIRRNIDPALLEYAGRGLFRARIFPFPSLGDRRVALEYEQLVAREGGLYRFVYPLSTEKFSSEPLESASVEILLEADRPICNAYCPTHRVRIEHLDSRRLRVSWEESGTRPDRDLVLYYSLADEAMDIRLVPYRPDHQEDGYFMLLAAAGLEGDLPVMPKDVVFVIDQSGSMQGAKIDQARRALAYCLRHLNRDDRFNVIAFSTGTHPFAEGLRPAGRGEIDGALDFVRRLDAAGGTNIDEALSLALRSRFDRRRPAFVVFITDGLPTVGERDPRAILGRLPETAARIFPFGVGYDVNAVLLDQLAEEHRGAPTYIRPSEDLETLISGFYDQIAQPVLTDLALEVHGARVYDMQPLRIPDLFRGRQLVLFGRYRGSGPVEVSLSGINRDRAASFEYSGRLPREETTNAFVGRLWATRRVGTLLRQIRLHGESAELVAEIRELGLRFGIASPYTSFLVDEDHAFHDPRPVAGATWGAGGAEWNADRLRPLGSPAAREPAARLRSTTGEEAFEVSKQVAEMIAAEAESRDEAGGVRIAAGRTFHRSGDRWTQHGHTADAPPHRITVGSEAYFALLRTHTWLGAVYALGERVIFEIDGVWYETQPAA